MTNTIDYQKIYDDTFGQQQNNWFNKLKDRFEKDEIHTAEKKFGDYKKELRGEYYNFKKAISSNHEDDYLSATFNFHRDAGTILEDNYFHRLVHDFKNSYRRYKNNHIQYFIEENLQELKKEFQYYTDSKLLKKNYDETQTLIYIANFLAVEQRYTICDTMLINPTDTEESISKYIEERLQGKKHTKEKSTTESPQPPLYYWECERSLLQKLYDLLLNAKKIKENKNFITSFTKQHPPEEQKTVWSGTQVQLVYLFYLIYGIEYKNERIFKIIPRLFLNDRKIKKRKKGRFSEKILNTTYNNNQDIFLEKNGTFSKPLNRIKEIFEQLDLRGKAST